MGCGASKRSKKRRTRHHIKCSEFLNYSAETCPMCEHLDDGLDAGEYIPDRDVSVDQHLHSETSYRTGIQPFKELVDRRSSAARMERLRRRHKQLYSTDGGSQFSIDSSSTLEHECGLSFTGCEHHSTAGEARWSEAPDDSGGLAQTTPSSLTTTAEHPSHQQHEKGVLFIESDDDYGGSSSRTSPTSARGPQRFPFSGRAVHDGRSSTSDNDVPPEVIYALPPALDPIQQHTRPDSPTLRKGSSAARLLKDETLDPPKHRDQLAKSKRISSAWW